MEKRRSKSLWDRISTVYNFHRDKKKLALYSYLHEWILEEEAKTKNAEMVTVETDVTEGLLDEPADKFAEHVV